MKWAEHDKFQTWVLYTVIFFANYWWNFMSMSDHGALHTLCTGVQLRGAVLCQWLSTVLSAVSSFRQCLPAVFFFFVLLTKLQMFKYLNYSNSFMAEYLNGKIGIRHRPSKYPVQITHFWGGGNKFRFNSNFTGPCSFNMLVWWYHREFKGRIGGEDREL